MESNIRKNRWRRAEAVRIREQRIITGYVEIKYPDIYKEAAGFYNLLNKKYPSKNDLRKTNEFELLKMDIPGEITKKYYKRRKEYPSIKKSVAVESHNPRDNMQLIIPLMEHPTTSTEPSGQEPPVETPVESQDIAKAAGSQVEPADIVETVEMIQDTIIEEAEIIIDGTNSFQPTLNDEIPNKIIEEIMDGLSQDPDLQSFFADIDIDIEEISPLEKELLSW